MSQPITRPRGPFVRGLGTGRRYEDLTGLVIGRWTVVRLARRSNNINRHLHWLCRCECGREIEVLGSSLKGIKSGGCRFCKAVRQRRLAIKCMWNRIKHGATQRGYAFRLNREKTFELLDNQQNLCAISGLPIELATGVRDFMHGGCTASLDRIDNTKGYIPGNVWWVHKDINRLKHALPLKKFLRLCHTISRHNRKTQDESPGRVPSRSRVG